MYWNYRVIKKEVNPGEFEYGIYEVFYDDEGKMETCTAEPIAPTGESEADLLAEIESLKEGFNGETLLFSDFQLR